MRAGDPGLEQKGTEQKDAGDHGDSGSDDANVDPALRGER